MNQQPEAVPLRTATVRLDGHGGERHVVALFGYAAGQTIDIVPVLPLTTADQRALHNTAFSPCVRTADSGRPVLLAPVVVAPPGDRDAVMSTVLRDHTFRWDEDTGECALCLGFGSRYNHAFAPNAWYVKHSPSRSIRFIALRPIAPGEEITVNYNGAPGDGSPVWFEVQP